MKKSKNYHGVQQPLASQKLQRLHVLLNHLSCTPLAEVASPIAHHNCFGAGNQASNFFMSHMLQHTQDIISIATTTAETAAQNSSKKHSTISVAVAAIPKKKQQHANNSRVLTVSPNDCGEDSFFIYHHTASEEKQSPDLELLASFGVADGVGGYAELGIDPSLMARQLMSNAHDLLASASTIKSAKSSDPLDILREAYYTIINKKQVAAGGTTACLVSLYKINNSSTKQRLTITDCDEEGEKPLVPTSSSEYILRAANLGDSGFMVIRLDTSEQRAQIIHKSSEQQYAFNTPFQLSVIAKQSADPKRKHKKRSNASNVIHNEPDDAQVESLQVQKNDIIILGTDGLFDNLFDEHVLQLTEKIYFLQKSNNKEEENKEQQLALLLVETANKISKQDNVVTPFAQNFTKAMRMTYRGGKPDDITVIVATV